MDEQIEKDFTYHRPTEEQIKQYELIRETAKQFAFLLKNTCPISRERSVAFTKLDELVMWANAAIARNDEETRF